MSKTAFMLLLSVATTWPQTGPDSCCNCSGSTGVVCLGSKEMRARVDHIEPLQPSGLGTGLNLSGAVVVDVRFEADGKVSCSRAQSGNPIAISAALVALPKWT